MNINELMPFSTLKVDEKRLALVVTDPQNDFLCENGVAWPLVGSSVIENDVVTNLDTLMSSAIERDIPIFISPHYYYEGDHHWQFGGALEKFMHASGMFNRVGRTTDALTAGSGADWLPRLKPLIEHKNTTIVSPHKIYGPESNDLVLQLRKRDIRQVVLAGMAANLCVEGHLRELVEQGFELIIVKDATASAVLDDGDGNAAALVNFKLIANAVVRTEELLNSLRSHLPITAVPNASASQG